ncbi:MAG: hypothetical protein MUC60_01005 [Oscillatoria sp. Prado101]|nr:hypothetical protein [Oscillatoria sp. Prado101]
MPNGVRRVSCRCRPIQGQAGRLSYAFGVWARVSCRCRPTRRGQYRALSYLCKHLPAKKKLHFPHWETQPK